MSCGKERIITSKDANVSLSKDTLFFDTVFTSVGSVTQSVKIYNNNEGRITLSSVRLAGGAQSPFKINIDGVSAIESNKISLRANDSLYLFVQVNVNPTSGQLPFVVEDSIEINYNGNSKWLQLRAYGQNAIFLKNQVITQNTNWNNALPYVILGSLKIRSGAVLSLDPGTKVFAHADAPILVNGTIHANGTVAAPVVFAGDRIDPDYKNLPAAWPGIFLLDSSQDNLFRHSIIQNAYQGLISQGFADNGNPRLTVSQSIVQNIYDAGILCLNTEAAIDNSLIANCGNNLAIMLGGKYTVVNCTVASYGNGYFAHKNPVLVATDFYNQNGNVFTAGLYARFINNIFWGDNGSVDNEVAMVKKGTGTFDVKFQNCLYKAKDAVTNATFSNCILNAAPLFDSINTTRKIYDFHLTKNANSPAVHAGTATSFSFDLDGKPLGAQPDLGCYQR